MKRNKLISIITSTVMIGAIGVTTAFATSAGTSADPLVSKSYVDDKITQIMTVIDALDGSTTTTSEYADKKYVDNKIEQVMTVLNGGNTNTGTGNVGSISDADRKQLVTEIVEQITVLGIDGTVSDSAKYVPVNATYGQVILGAEGCEIILRSGTSVAFVPSTDGIVNATNGTNLMNDAQISKDNIIIIPREDGRGVKVTSENAWFIIKGDYTVR